MGEITTTVAKAYLEVYVKYLETDPESFEGLRERMIIEGLHIVRDMMMAHRLSYENALDMVTEYCILRRPHRAELMRGKISPEEFELQRAILDYTMIDKYRRRQRADDLKRLTKKISR